MTCEIELEREIETERESMRKVAFPVDAAILRRIRDGITWINDPEPPQRGRRTARMLEKRDTLVQYRCEDTSGLVITREIDLTVESLPSIYKIGDGAEFTYAFESLEALDGFISKVASATDRRVTGNLLPRQEPKPSDS